MPKRYNTPHRSRVVKTRLSEDEYADFTARLAPMVSASPNFSGSDTAHRHTPNYPCVGGQ